MNFIEQNDPDVWSAVAAEIERQEDGLEMIASENYTSPAVMQAAGSVLTNKYAEGYPGRRYYGGCEHVDVAEQIAIDPDVQGGAPVIRGTRVPVAVLVESCAAGDDIAEVARAYRVTEQQVRLALGYAADLVRGERTLAIPR